MPNRRRSPGRAVRRALLGAVCAVLAAAGPAVRSATVPTGFQEYHVVGNEQHVWDLFNRPVVEQGPFGFNLSDAMLSVVAVTASSASQVIYYDHWEDNTDVTGDGVPDFEQDIVNAQTQAQTLVLGDGNPANGDACAFIAGPCAGDTIAIGDTLTLNSNVNTGTGAAPNCGGPANLTGCVPLNPRVGTDIRFDGGDRLVTSGGPVSLVHIQEPTANLPGVLGGAVEVLSRQALGAATSYSVPVGEDSPVNLGAAGNPFVRVDLDLVAFDDATSVQVTSPGAGTVSFTLDAGEHWSSQGRIDNGPVNPAIALVINEGTKVSTDKPLGGLIFASANGNYATREFALLPDLLHGTDFVTTAPGDDPGVAGDEPKDLYVYNPDPFNPLTVTFTDSLGTGSFPVGPNATVAYSTGAGAGRVPPPGSTVRLTSDRNFWGVTAYDSQGLAHDWGHSWLASAFLSDTYTVPHAPDNPAAPPGASPVYVAATAANTCVRVDFDNDGAFDQVGDGNGGLLPFAGGTCTSGYRVDAPGPPGANPKALRVYDNNAADGTPANDITGTRIMADKPVALAYGLDTDLAPTSGAGILDLGYAIYPVSQTFLDPVLVVDKRADRATVPAAGGAVTYTIEVEAFVNGPLTGLQVTDLLPAGVPGASYVPGSTVVTNPDLSQVTGASADPAIGTVGGRDRLDWSAVLAANVDTLNPNETLTIEYTVNIPAGPGAVLTNEATAVASLGASVFQPTDSVDVLRTDVALVKAVADDGSPEPGETLAYTLTVTNNGAVAETNVTVTDPLPPGTTFTPGTIVDAGPFTGSYDAGQNAVVWTAASLAAGVGPFDLAFEATVNPATPAGTVITNAGWFESDQTPSFASSEVTTTILGPALAIAKSALGDPDPVHPGETVTYEVTVENTGAGAATNLLVEDLFPANATYVAGSMQWRLNAGAFTTLTDAADADEGTALVDRVRLLVAQLDPGEDLAFRFRVTVDPGTGGLSLGNQATVGADQVAPADTNLVQIAIDGDADITGHLFLDVDGDGAQGAGEPDLANVDVVVTDEDGGVQRVSTDALGDYAVTVPADNAVSPGQTVLDVDETDPDLPNGASLTTGNDPQTVTAVSGGSLAAAAVGYQPPPLSITKTSSAGGEVAPGDTITYTITVDNDSGVNQSGVTVSDPLPPGTSFVAGSTQVTAPAIRVTEYYVALGDFSGNVLNLALDQDLEPDYFVIVQGSDGQGNPAGDRGPDENYALLVADPFATGTLNNTGASNVIRLRRGNNVNDWVGVVTVVESLPNAGGDGFRLLDVQQVNHPGASTSGSAASSTPWSGISQVMLMGGFNGAGCGTAEAQATNMPVCHARFFPSGASTINWTRDATSAPLGNAVSTVMVIEWGPQWNVQRTRVQGNNGGDGADATGEYNTAGIAAVSRENTWVWGTGHTLAAGTGDSAEGVLLTLGDGVTQNGVETQVAAGIEQTNRAVDFEVWALTHPELAVDHRFKVDGDNNELAVDVPVDAQTHNRMALSYNGGSQTNTTHPRTVFSARYLDDATVRLERRRRNSPFPAWVQGIGYAALTGTRPGGAPASLVPGAAGYELPPGTRMTVTYQVVVDDPLAPGVTQIVNTATVASNESPAADATVVDDVIRPRVSVAPNGAATVITSGASQTIAFLLTVTNEGTRDDAFDLAAASEAGLRLELVDPATGAVLATDSNGDGAWDGGATPGTGTLAPGETASYRLRVTVPAGAPAGAKDTVTLTATSSLHASVSGAAANEISVVAAGVPGAGDVLVRPDGAATAEPGETVVYSHEVTNATGASDVFDLSTSSSQGWSTSVHRDTNGDGTYTPGVDTAIANTAVLADGESQTVFVVVDVPGGAAAGTVDTTHVTATSRNDPDIGGLASDTTTVGAVSVLADLTLSGGGTKVVNAGETAVYPGEITNLGPGPDRFELTLSASPYGPGGPVADGLNHASELWFDTNGDGAVDLLLARDADGDGAWDEVDYNADGTLEPFDPAPPGASAADGDADGVPDVPRPSGATLEYELHRPVDPAQTPYRDPVALTATSLADPSVARSVTATTAVLLATRAVIGDFVAYGSGEGVVVQWETVSEHGTVGFRLMRLDEHTGEYRPVNRKLLPGLLHSRNGGIYRYVDPRARVGDVITYRLVELEATGNEIAYGPYTVAVAPSAGAAGVEPAPALDAPLPRFERVERAMSAVQEARIAAKKQARGRAGAQRRARVGRRAKVAVPGSGVYYLDAETIASVLDRSARTVEALIRAGRLALFNRGERVATSRAADDAGLYFYGEAVDSQYTDENVYWLAEGEGLDMGTRDAGRPAPVAIGVFTDTVHVEGNRYTLTHLFDDPDDDYWMWDFRYEDLTFPMFESAFTVPSPGVARAPDASAVLTVRLHGGSETSRETDHRATVVLNGTELGTAAFSGLLPHTATFEVPANLLEDGDNRVEVRGHTSGVDGEPSVFYINDFTLAYPRRFVAEGDTLAFSSAGRRVVSVAGFGSADVEVLDLADPRRPRRLLRTRVDAAGTTHSVTFTASEAPAAYLAFTPAAARRPASVVADAPSDLASRDHRVDYLVITATDMVAAAERLAAYRAGQGLRTLVVDLEDIYDEFHHGIEDADAIWSFLRHAHTRWRVPPRYVVLAGEGSFDYKDHLGHGDAVVPTLLTPTPQGLFPSDNLFADVAGNDWVPEMAIGRLPVIDARELDAFTDKLRAYEQAGGEWTRRVVTAADAPDLGGDFPRDSDRIAELVPPTHALERIHLDETTPDDARARMLGALSSGRGFVSFFGHSGHTSLGNTDLLNVDDVATLGNGERLAVVTAFTCLAGQFGFPGQESIAEALLVSPTGGAAAVWSPSGLSLDHRARLLGEGFYAATFEAGELVLGEIILRAQARYARDGVDRYLLDVYNLIGDPATIVK